MKIVFILSLFIATILSTSNHSNRVEWTKPYYVALTGYSFNASEGIEGLPHSVSGRSSIFFGASAAQPPMWQIDAQAMLNNETLPTTKGDLTIYSTLSELDSFYDAADSSVAIYGRLVLCLSCTDEKILPYFYPEYIIPYAPVHMEPAFSVVAANFTHSSEIVILFNTWNVADSEKALDSVREALQQQFNQNGNVGGSSYFTMQFMPVSPSIFGQWYSVQIRYAISDNNFTDIYKDWGHPSQWRHTYNRSYKCNENSLGCFWMYGLTGIAANEELKRKWMQWPASDDSDDVKNDKKSSAGNVAGFIVLGLVLTGVVAAVIWFVMKRRNDRMLLKNQYDAL